MPFRFVHTADLHLDSPLKSLALRDDALAELVATASRDALTAIVDLCLAEDVEALIVAGDLYDGQETSMKTAAFLAAEMTRLADGGVRVFIVRGNHDAQSTITKELQLPPAVQVFDGRGGFVSFESRDGLEIAVHGVSFSQAHMPDSLLPKYKPPVQNAFNIGVMHTSLDGAPGHDPYAPVSAAALADHGYDYWALGHIHRRAVHNVSPAIVMPGIPQGRHVNEDGPKSVTLATVADGGAVTLAERSVAQVAFARLAVDLPEDEDWDGLRRRLTGAFSAVAEQASAPENILRLELTTADDFAWRLRRDADLLRETATEIAGRIDGVWVEKIAVETRDVADAASATPAAELHEFFAETLATPEFQTEAAEIVAALVSTPDIPAELRDDFGADEAATQQTALRLAEAGATEALARLGAGAEADD